MRSFYHPFKDKTIRCSVSGVRTYPSFPEKEEYRYVLGARAKVIKYVLSDMGIVLNAAVNVADRDGKVKVVGTHGWLRRGYESFGQTVVVAGGPRTPPIGRNDALPPLLGGKDLVKPILHLA